ncbi:MAG TPA: TonB-dependent receptor [Novosphingobium sp.]|nr:TonB-dependent receptor [Novosphingobium sp.]
MKASSHLAALVMIGAAAPVPVQAAARMPAFSIAPGSLSSALTAFSQVTGMQVIADPAVLRGRRTAGVQGSMSPDKAMEALLQGTGLAFQRRGEVILIAAAREPRSRRPDRGARPRAAAAPIAAPATVEAQVPIVVIGQRIADQRALAVKRRARNIVDAVSSDEARRLPDNTVVDAMRRIPGVSVVPIADNEHPRDVPIAPVVRGLTQAYNNVTINGLPIASTGIPDAASNSASRGVRLDILPTSLVSRLLVVKTFTPDADPNAIGAAIDLQTRSAFDNGGRPFLSVEGGVARPSQHGQVQKQAPVGLHASMTTSRTFGSNGQFGLVVSANYQHLENNSDVHATGDSNFLSFFEDDGSEAQDGSVGNGIAVPRQDKYWYNGSDRRHTGATVRAEADLGDLRLSALAADYVFRDGYTRNENIIDPEGADVLDQTPTSGRFGSASVQVGYRGGTTRSETQLAQFDADWHPGARDRVSLRGALSRATMHEKYEMVKFTAGQDATGAVVGNPALGFDYDTSKLQFSFNIPAAAYYDLSLYSGDYWRHRSRRATAEVATLRADWQHNSGDGDEGLGFAGGAAWTQTDYSYSYQSLAYGTTDLGLTLAQAGYVTSAALPFNANGLRLIAIDPVRAWQLFDENQSSIIVTDGPEDDHQDDFTHREAIVAGYATARFATGPVEVLGGARLEHTAIRTKGTIALDDDWAASTTSSSYLRLLPSVLVNYAVAPELKLRAGYSRTIGRPSYESYSPRSSIDFENASAPGDPDAAGVRVNLGNPQIAPRTSDNLDLSVEWSLPRRLDGMIAAAVFHKQIRDEIFDATTVGYAYEGVFYRNAMVTRPTNATGAHISGVELSAVAGSLGAVAPFLRDVGISANWALFDGAVTVPMTSGATRTVGRLVGQPSQIRNLSVFYNRDGFELRAAANWTGRALRSIAPDTPWQDVYWAPRSQIDVQARYHFGAGASIILDVANVTEQRLTSVTGPHWRWLKDSYSVPRIVRLSFHWGFGQ